MQENFESSGRWHDAKTKQRALEAFENKLNQDSELEIEKA